MKIVLLGPPGAGKGTQGAMIAHHYAIPNISTGDIFRKNIREETELGLAAKSYIDRGLLVPDELTTGLVASRIAEEDCRNGYILDGFPRTIPQAECLTKILEERNDALTVALDVDVPDDVILDRMSGRRVCSNCGETYHVTNLPSKEEGICDQCGSDLIHREDDRIETVKRRLEVYREQTAPLIEYYREKGILKTVDGNRPRNDVFADVRAILEA